MPPAPLPSVQGSAVHHPPPQSGCKGQPQHPLAGGRRGHRLPQGGWGSVVKWGIVLPPPKLPSVGQRAVTASGLLSKGRRATITRNKTMKLQFQPQQLQD